MNKGTLRSSGIKLPPSIVKRKRHAQTDSPRAQYINIVQVIYRLLTLPNVTGLLISQRIITEARYEVNEPSIKYT